MEVLALFGKTLLLRPYVFIFLAAALVISAALLGGKRTGIFFLVTWAAAFLAEFSSTRTGFPFGWYFYTGSSRGNELYLSNVPFMDSLSFTFLLFGSYCLALMFVLPSRRRGLSFALEYDAATRRSGTILALSALFFMLIDVAIDPVALRGDRWFLGKLYYYPEPGIHFGVPLANYLGWGLVGLVALGIYQQIDRRLTQRVRPGQAMGPSQISQSTAVLLGSALYYIVLCFNLAVAFWINEPLIGICGIFIYLPVTALLLLKLAGRLPAGGFSRSSV
jgi:uncharacterized membrane protein